MSRIAEIATARSVQLSLKSRLGFWARLRHHVARLDAAHDRRARIARLSDEAVRDTGRTREDLLTESSHDPALPFFFQSGFGRR